MPTYNAVEQNAAMLGQEQPAVNAAPIVPETEVVAPPMDISNRLPGSPSGLPAMPPVATQAQTPVAMPATLEQTAASMAEMQAGVYQKELEGLQLKRQVDQQLNRHLEAMAFQYLPLYSFSSNIGGAQINVASALDTVIAMRKMQDDADLSRFQGLQRDAAESIIALGGVPQKVEVVNGVPHITYIDNKQQQRALPVGRLNNYLDTLASDALNNGGEYVSAQTANRLMLASPSDFEGVFETQTDPQTGAISFTDPEGRAKLTDYGYSLVNNRMQIRQERETRRGEQRDRAMRSDITAVRDTMTPEMAQQLANKYGTTPADIIMQHDAYVIDNTERLDAQIAREGRRDAVAMARMAEQDRYLRARAEFQAGIRAKEREVQQANALDRLKASHEYISQRANTAASRVRTTNGGLVINTPENQAAYEEMLAAADEIYTRGNTANDSMAKLIAAQTATGDAGAALLIRQLQHYGNNRGRLETLNTSNVNQVKALLNEYNRYFSALDWQDDFPAVNVPTIAPAPAGSAAARVAGMSDDELQRLATGGR